MFGGLVKKKVQVNNLSAVFKTNKIKQTNKQKQKTKTTHNKIKQRNKQESKRTLYYAN